ncbi:MipA/OmpV family protein [Chitiniphilus eburneus]|uniref:MipA/OmpV family protein n=1 Tax=Chitiniphilus eburneus TaxID=2571148 RepID=A0A4U0Q1K4_9NEIS|nr:MipA/OmpV family protein [Chitiniphilus eburneus]TJZ74795.1 MipA/OmpV family protein [Chitiniphilus eburneus]
MKFRWLFLAGLACAQAQAGGVTLPAGGLPNLVGVGVGSTPQYSGGDESVIGVVPGLRYVTESGRLVEWYGPVAQLNFGELEGWQWGPTVALRLGRKDVDDEVVARLHEIDTTLEAGAFFGYEYLNRSGIPWRARFGANVLTNAGQEYNGARFNVSGTFWLPLSERWMVGTGLGGSWASADFNRVYYGVTRDDANASGLPVYTPGAGMQQVFGWVGTIVQVHPHWYAGAMVFMQRLTGDAGDSPIVTERGDRNQLTFGVGLGYAWR